MAVDLTVKFYRTEITANLQSYDLRVVVDSATEMVEEIFVFQRGASPAPTAGAEPTDKFVCVADPVDLQEYPVNTPNLDAEIPYYRLKEVTFSFRSMDILAATKVGIEEDLQKLVDSLNAVADTVLMEEVTYA